MRSSCRSLASALPGVRSPTRPSCAPALECTTSCRTRWVTAWTRTRPSIRPTASRRCPYRSCPSIPLAPVPAKALLVPGGVQPNLKMPTLISYSLGIEQEITPNTSLTIRYVGSHGYHELIGVDANEPVPVICPASPCPAVYPAQFPGATRRHAGSRGHVLHPCRNSEGESYAGEYLDLVLRWRQQLQRTAAGLQSSFQSRPVVPRRLHLVEGAR